MTEQNNGGDAGVFQAQALENGDVVLDMECQGIKTHCRLEREGVLALRQVIEDAMVNHTMLAAREVKGE
ncbi:MAG: hypothetical protein VX464_20895 [Pseudomonadota bacterium]|nr:hypothetical protein [Pseudomonadota bacterium]